MIKKQYTNILLAQQINRRRNYMIVIVYAIKTQKKNKQQVNQ